MTGQTRRAARAATSIAAVVWICSAAFGAAAVHAAAPTILRTGVSEATTSSITLEAAIDPQGKGTSYHFAFGPADCDASPCTSVPAPKEGTIQAGSEAVTVKAQIEGLTPGATYHLRVYTHNSEGAVKSPDRLFAPYALPQAFEACPNEGFRQGQGALLPDCRAYEQASPVAKNGGDVTNRVSFVGASSDGDAVAFLSDAGIPGGEGSQELPLYLASRGEGGWSTQGLLPSPVKGQEARVVGWLPDYSQVYDIATFLGSPITSTFLARSSAGGALSTIGPYAARDATRAASYDFAGAAEGGSVVLFESDAQLPGTAGIAGKPNVYVWERDSATLSLAGAMNDGSPPAKGAFPGAYDWAQGTSRQTLEAGGVKADYYTQDQHALSTDGKTAYFTAAGTGRLYARMNPTEPQSALDGEGKCTEAAKACTIQINVSQRGAPDPAGAQPAAFQGASADGTKVFFTSTEKLTNDANTGPEQEPAAIERSDLEGKDIEADFIPTHAKGIAVHGEYIYWANPSQRTIGRAKLDGTEIDQGLIDTGPGTPQYVAVDDKCVYWTNWAEGESLQFAGKPPREGTIGRAKLGSGGAEEVDPGFITGASAPQGIAIDDEHIYWANANSVTGGELTVARADLDGEGIDQLFIVVSSGSRRPSGVAVNAAHIYWATYTPFASSTEVHLRDLSGDPESEGRAFPDGLGLADPPFAIHGIALSDNYLYWASAPNGTIARVDVNLSGAEPGDAEVEFIKGLSRPVGIAVDSGHIYWSSNGESPPNPGNDLYRYDVESGGLTDLSVDPGDQNGAEVKGVLGISDDGSYVYFAANGDLDGAAGPAEPGDCSGGFLTGSGSCNVYLWHAGEVRFVARVLNNGGGRPDAANWVPTRKIGPNVEAPKSSRVSPDGRTLLFRSVRRLTAYDNEGTPQLYRYYAPQESILCVSCNPTGAAPTGAPTFASISPNALLPTNPSPLLLRVLSEDGKRVFFETTDPLTAADTNYGLTDAQGQHCPDVGGYLNHFPICRDVYEWEAEGKGSCQTPGGCLYLLSTGTEAEASFLAGSSASGDDVFIYTRARLVDSDADEQRDVYDLRVGGGLVSQSHPPPPPPPCEGDGCKGGVSQMPQQSSAGSTDFAGPPDPQPRRPKCRKGSVRRHGRCAKRHGRKHHHRGARSKLRESR